MQECVRVGMDTELAVDNISDSNPWTSRAPESLYKFYTESKTSYFLKIVDEIYDISSIVLSKHRVSTATYFVHREAV
jgi:hypothetical protein